MHSRATVLGADTVLNAPMTATGSTFAIGAEVTVSVELGGSGEVCGSIAETPDVNMHLVERCVELIIKAFSDDEGDTVETESDLPIVVGLENSSVTTSATVLATSSALSRSTGPGPGTDTSRLNACRVGVRAARGVSVTAIGVFDDAMASMVGDVVVTDSTEDDLIACGEVDWDVLVWTSPECTYSVDVDASRCESITPMVDFVADPVLEGRYAEAMAVNGLALSAAFDFPTDSAVETMPIVDGASLSGISPGVVAVGDRTDPERVKELWGAREREIRPTTTRIGGTQVQ